MLPFVSVIVPTYNRRKFIPFMIYMFKYQKYPQDRMELLIYDDGTDKIDDLIPNDTNIKYFSSSEKQTIGYKRNYLNDMAQGDIIIAMDDDDYYPPNRVTKAVTRIMSSSALIGGTSELYFYFVKTGKIKRFNKIHNNHATNGSYVYTKEYAKVHRYDDTKTFGEEKSFTNNFTEPMVQINSLDCLLCIVHDENTFNKDKCRLEDTNMALKNIVKDKYLLEFYKSFIL